MNESEIEAAGTKAMLELIEKYGSWGITNKNWTGDSWTLEKILARVLVDLGTSAFVAADVTPSIFNTSQLVVGVSLKESAVVRSAGSKGRVQGGQTLPFESTNNVGIPHHSLYVYMINFICIFFL